MCHKQRPNQILRNVEKARFNALFLCKFRCKIDKLLLKIDKKKFHFHTKNTLENNNNLLLKIGD